jgi:hypothetical protein
MQKKLEIQKTKLSKMHKSQKKKKNQKKILCHEIEPLKDRAMNEGDNPSF